MKKKGGGVQKDLYLLGISFNQRANLNIGLNTPCIWVPVCAPY